MVEKLNQFIFNSELDKLKEKADNENPPPLPENAEDEEIENDFDF